MPFSSGTPLYTIDPASVGHTLWQALNTIFVLYNVLEIPFVIFFPVEIEGTGQGAQIVGYMTAISIYLFLLDIIVTFNTGFYVEGELEKRRLVIALRFLRSEFILDVVPILTLIFHYFWRHHYWEYFGFLFYLKLYEVFKF